MKSRKIIKLLICNILIVTALIYVCNAAYVTNDYEVATLIRGSLYDKARTPVNLDYFYNLKRIYETELPVTYTPSYEFLSAVFGVYVPRIEPDTFYTFSIGISTSEIAKTGEVIPDEFVNLRIFDTSIFGDITTILGEYYVPKGTTTINSDYYRMFYDSTSEILSCTFYIPKSLADTNPELLQHVYLLVACGKPDVMGTSIKFTSFTGVNASATYSDQLNAIIEKLEAISSSGGLTQDQIQTAVMDALQQYADQEEAAIKSKADEADQLVDQLIELVPSAKLQTAMEGLTAAVSGSQRSCVLALPTLIEPISGTMIMEAQSLDLTGTIDNMITSEPVIGTVLNLVRWLNLLVLCFTLLRSIMNIITYVTSPGGED